MNSQRTDGNRERRITTSTKLPPAYHRAATIRRDLGRAVGLYGLGDRSEIVLRTLARGRAAYDAIGEAVPVPIGIDAKSWKAILDALVRQYRLRPYDEACSAA